MKTSNKILLTIFISVLLILTIIHVALNQRYKGGHFVITDAGQSSYDTIVLKPVKFVRLKGLDNVLIIPSDTYKLELQKNMPAAFKQYVSGDTLVLSGSSTVRSSIGEGYEGLSEEVRLYLPQVEAISAQSCELVLGGSADSTKAVNVSLELLGSSLSFRNYRRGDETSSLYYGEVSIDAKLHSEIELSANYINFNSLAAQLEKSIFRELSAGEIKKFSLVADDSSSVQVGGSNLRKLAAVAKD